MFSSDKNIETIGQLVKLIKEYIGLQGEYLKLDVTEKTVRLVTALLLCAVFALLLVAILVYLSAAVAFAIAPSVGYPAAFSLIAAFHIFIFILLVVFRKSWIEKPLVKFIASLLIEK